jgi:hypothetical protein
MATPQTPLHSTPAKPAAVPAGEVVPLRREAAVRPAKVVVKKYGFMGALLRPIGLAVALIILGWGAMTIGTNYYRSYQRHLEYAKTSHDDRSYLRVLLGQAGPALSTGETKFVYRDIDGKLHRVVVATSALDQFVNDALVALDNDRDEIVARARAEMKLAFDNAFADRDKAINDYADWFFEWKRSYAILAKTLSSTLTGAASRAAGGAETVGEAIEHDIKDYFMEHYTERVLKPEARDPVIQARVDALVRRAHEGFKQSVARRDEQLQAFLASQTHVLEDLPADARAAEVHLDWDVQKWKAPAYLTEGKAFEGIVGVGSMAAGGTFGALALGPVISRAAASSFGALSRTVATSVGGRVALGEGGAAVGSVLGPVGTAVGTVAGLALGAGVDYVMAKKREQENRAEFISANQKALDATIEQWRGKLDDGVDGGVARWFDDARAGMVLSRDKQPAPVPQDKLQGGRTNTPTS